MVFACLSAGAFLLGAAGIAKLLNPDVARRAFVKARFPGGRYFNSPMVVRVVGLTEVAIAAVTLTYGGPVAAGLFATAYLVFALSAVRLLRVAPDTDCGCFGQAGGSISRWHLLVTVGFLLVGLAAVITPTTALVGEIQHQPFLGFTVAIAAASMAWLSYLLMTALPQLQQATRLRNGATP